MIEEMQKKQNKNLVKILVGIIVILIVSLLFVSNTLTFIYSKGMVCITYNTALYEDVKLKANITSSEIE